MLQRFTESFIATPEYYSLVEKRKITESDQSNLANMIKENRLSESTVRYLEKNNLVNLKDKNVYRFPISRYDWVNANGRKYEKRLWQRIINEQKEAYQGNTGLADHPGDDEDGQFKNTGIVWLDMGLDEANQIVWGEGVLVGPHGRLAEEILEAGGRIGFSSSGFGELEESDKSTVRYDTYILERPADIVLNPSQSVYGTWDMKLPQNKDSITQESTERKIKESTEVKENKMSEGSKFSKLEEKRIIRDITKFYEEAMAIADPQSRLEELQDLALPFNENTNLVNEDIKSKIDTSIEEARAEIKKAIEEHVKIKSVFEVETADELKEGIKKIATDTQLFEREAQDWKAIAEGLQEKVKELQAVNSSLPTVEAYNTAMAYNKKLKESFKVRESELLSEISKHTTSIETANKKVSELNAELKKANSLIEKQGEHIEKLKEYATNLRNRVIAENNKKKADVEAKKIAEAKKNEINFKPKSGKNDMLADYAESELVEGYYNDLEERHGKVMEQHKDRIMNCKTLKEAMKVYTGILAEMDVSSTSKLSEAFDPEDRKRIIEAQTKKVISGNKTLRKPLGWE